LAEKHGMNEIPNLNPGRHSLVRRFFCWVFSRRIVRRFLICVAVLLTLVAVFYTKADWRGERLLENCKRELTAKGEVWKWSAYAPAQVPDEQNIFKAPNISQWFSDHRSLTGAPLDHPLTNDFARRLASANSTREITDPRIAQDYLAWSDQFQTNFDSIKSALQRPYCRMVNDSSQPLAMEFPNVATWTGVIRTVEQRAKCHLLLGQSETAWKELALLHELRGLVERQGRFITTEGAWMVRGDVTHSLEVIAKGLQMHAWSEPQLRVLQRRLKDTDFLTQFADALRCGRALLLSSMESGALFRAEFTAGGNGFAKGLAKRTMALLLWLAPRGEIYETFSNRMRAWQGMIDVLSPTNQMVRPADAAKAFAWWDRAAEGLPGLLSDQTHINEGQIACALERYRLAHGQYPDSLEALVPEFIEQVPHDIVNGDPMKYRRTEKEGFLLYSIGWNETDEGGDTISKPARLEDLKQGDWVW
jgi:hypothetical protein